MARWPVRSALVVCAYAVPVILLVAAGCQQHSSPHSPAVPAASLTRAAFAGEQACRDCHAAEFRLHQASRHNTTLRTLDAHQLGAMAPPAGLIPDSNILLRRSGAGYRIEKADSEGIGAPVQLVFGSGKTGMTFAAMQESGDMIEISRSYFPSRHIWYVTPGHETRPSAEIGLRCTPDEGRGCLRCHGVTVTDGPVLPDPALRGVNCETCHGPAAAHAAAMRTGNTADLHLARLTTLRGEASIKVCSACHRGRSAVNLQSEQAGMTNRFQTYGLEESRCYRESQDKLSCVSCHNPHTNAATDAHSYEKTCLSCHSGAAATAATAFGKVCPVNPRTDCVRCHMPQRPVFRKSFLPVNMAEHRIAVYR